MKKFFDGLFGKGRERDFKQSASAWYKKGLSLNSLGRYEEAIRCFDKALDADPRHADAWSDKGSSLASLGRCEEAIGCYDKALGIDPRHINAWFNKSLSLNSLGRHEEAVIACDKALEINPQDACAWGNKGDALAGLGRYEDAIFCHSKAIEIDPRNAVPWNNKGITLRHLGRYEEAISCYDEALKVDPSWAASYGNKAIALMSLGRYEEAIRCCDTAVEIDPQNAGAWHNKGLAEGKLGRFHEAARSEQKSIELAPSEYADQTADAQQEVRACLAEQIGLELSERLKTLTATIPHALAEWEGSEVFSLQDVDKKKVNEELTILICVGQRLAVQLGLNKKGGKRSEEERRAICDAFDSHALKCLDDSPEFQDLLDQRGGQYFQMLQSHIDKTNGCDWNAFFHHLQREFEQFCRGGGGEDGQFVLGDFTSMVLMMPLSTHYWSESFQWTLKYLAGKE